MGCSAAKNITVEPLESAKNGDISNQNGHGDVNELRKSSIPPSVNDVPPLESEEPPAEVLETPVVNNLQKKGSSLSFELAFEEDKEESIIKKHPPKRFQPVDERPSSPVTLEKLQEKLEEAELRRQQILAQRIQSAKQRNGMKKQSSEASMTDNDHLRIPIEEQSS